MVTPHAVCLGVLGVVTSSCLYVIAPEPAYALTLTARDKADSVLGALHRYRDGRESRSLLAENSEGPPGINSGDAAPLDYDPGDWPGVRAAGYMWTGPEH